MTTKMKRRVRIVGTIMAIIASLLMVSCGRKGEAPFTVSTGTQAGDLVVLE